MKERFLLKLVILSFAISCNPSSIKTSQEKLDSCEEIKYGLIWSIDINNAEWRNNYMNYINSCINDTSMVKLLARLDGEYGNYTFFIYGMMNSKTIDHLENIYNNYPIGFYSPGCEENEYGLVYNEELKRYLQKNEGLNFDSIIENEFSK